jgi:hypothetical protein
LFLIVRPGVDASAPFLQHHSFNMPIAIGFTYGATVS